MLVSTFRMFGRDSSVCQRCQNLQKTSRIHVCASAMFTAVLWSNYKTRTFKLANGWQRKFNSCVLENSRWKYRYHRLHSGLIKKNKAAWYFMKIKYYCRRNHNSSHFNQIVSIAMHCVENKLYNKYSIINYYMLEFSSRFFFFFNCAARAQ